LVQDLLVNIELFVLVPRLGHLDFVKHAKLHMGFLLDATLGVVQHPYPAPIEDARHCWD
jgi:hypothetical protein